LPLEKMAGGYLNSNSNMPAINLFCDLMCDPAKSCAAS
jgi:hypothetical protein